MWSMRFQTSLITVLIALENNPRFFVQPALSEAEGLRTTRFVSGLYFDGGNKKRNAGSTLAAQAASL
jgi:hypothetical protein